VREKRITLPFETRLDIFDNFNNLTPFNCGKLMRTFVTASSTQVLREAIDRYSNLFPQKIRGIKAPLPITEEYLNKQQDSLMRQNILFLETSKELYEMANRATKAKATLYYYSWHSFLAFLMYTFLRFNDTSRGHGLRVKPMEVDKIGVTVYSRKKQGFFNRILDFFYRVWLSISSWR
jgi:hypothetical protein